MPATEYLLRSKNGQESAMEVSGRFLGGRILLSFVDVSQRKAAEEEIRWLGYYRHIRRRLPNRRLLLDRLEEADARSQRPGMGNRRFAASGHRQFQVPQRNPGHDHGDACCRLVATRSEQLASRASTPWRAKGGDEFAVVLEDLPERAPGGRAPRRASGLCARLGGAAHAVYLRGAGFPRHRQHGRGGVRRAR